MDTEELVGKAGAGDKDALVKLVMDKKDEYYRLAYVYMENREDSLDALQDMIVLLFQNIKKLKNPEAFYSWSKTILVNCCKSMLRKKGRVLLFNDPREEEYFENYPGRELKQDIMACMKRLNKNQQEAIKLKYFLDMDYGTIARITGVPHGTVKSRIFQGLAKLKELFGGMDDERN